MRKAFLLCAVIPGIALGMGCSDSETSGTGGIGGMGGMGGAEAIGPLTWTVSDYDVVSDDCQAVTPGPGEGLTAFEITIVGDTATLESVDFDLGGVADPYSPDDDPVVFDDEYEIGVETAPDCVVEATDKFTVNLGNPALSLDQNSTADVTWDYTETDASDPAGACTPAVWGLELPCASQVTFTLTQE